METTYKSVRIVKESSTHYSIPAYTWGNQPWECERFRTMKLAKAYIDKVQKGGYRYSK